MPPAARFFASVFHTSARVTGRDWLGLLGLGIVGQCLYQYCFIAGLSHDQRRQQRAAHRRDAGADRADGRGVSATSGSAGCTGLGASLSLAGIYVVVGQGAHIGGSSLRGDMMMLAAVVCWTALYPGSRAADGAALAGRRHGPVDGRSARCFTCPPWLPHLRSVRLEHVSAVTWLTIVYSALFALCVAYTIWYAAVREIGSASTSIYSNLVPVVAMVTAVVFLGEAAGASKARGAAAAVSRLRAWTLLRPGVADGRDHASSAGRHALRILLSVP